MLIRPYVYLATLLLAPRFQLHAQITVLKNATVIDGSGAAPRAHASLVLDGPKIQSITDSSAKLPANAIVIDVTGKFIMPSMINSHGHIGLLIGTKTASANYTKDNAERHLLQYQDYGVQAVQVMGTDHDEVYPWRDESQAGQLPGAYIYTAGRGFGVPQGMPPLSMGMDQVYRPTTAEEARKDVDELAQHHPYLVKMWVDDFYGQFPKMKPEIYTAIIDEAHKNHLRVAAHLFYAEDAQRLTDAGLDIFAHSVRDKEIPDSLIAEMKQKHVTYIPTLALDEFAFAYQDDPSWLNDPFFKDALEPGVYEMITSPKYKSDQQADKKAAIEKADLPIALRNVKKVYDAGIPVALGTDSGATPIRPFGFAEHQELELLVQAGLTPLEAITVATKNPADLLHISNKIGTLAPGLEANFILLDKDPSIEITNTRSINQVWKQGKKVSQGPHSSIH